MQLASAYHWFVACFVILTSVHKSPFDVVSLSQDLGVVSSQSDPVVFAIGVVRDPVIKFVNQNIQDENRSAYYWSSFSSIHDVVRILNDHLDLSHRSCTARYKTF